MEGFQAEDRHNPLPHIAQSTTALKSAYSNTAFGSTRTAVELWKLLIIGGREWWNPDVVAASAGMARLREVSSRKGSCSPGQISAGLHMPRYNALQAGDFLLCQRVLAPMTRAGLPQAAETPSPPVSLSAGASVTSSQTGRGTGPVRMCRYAWSSISGRQPGGFSVSLPITR